MKQALGLIETVGLAAAVEAADSAVKAADVVLLGFENARGNGRIVIKLEGSVGAVTAAVEAAVKKGETVGEVFAYKIIPRPSDDLEKYFYPREREKKDFEEKEPEEKGEEQKPEEAAKSQAACNLCGDPLCMRRPGEPHKNCIHHSQE